MKVRGNRWVRGIDRWVGAPLAFVLGLFKGVGRPLDSRVPKKILMLKLNAVGDTLLFLTVAEILKTTWPDVQITYLGSTINQEVLAKSPYLDRIMILDLVKMFRSPGYLLKYVHELRTDRYDVVIDGSQWERVAACTVGLLRADMKIGFRTPGQWKHYVYHAYVPHRRDRHEMYCFHDLLTPLGIRAPVDVTPTLQVEDNDRQRIESLLGGRVESGAPILVIHPGCGEHGDYRQWSLEHYRDLGRKWLEANGDGWIVLTGTGSEVEICRWLEQELPDRVMSLAGSLDIGMTSALLERAAMLVCGNTGMMHLASAFQTPTVAIHGPTDPVKWGPINPNAVVVQSPLECAPCLYLGHEYGCDCPRCMDAIGVDVVWQALVDLEKDIIVSHE